MANPKVLIVEDDKIIVDIEQWRLSKLGYDVCGSAGTGAEAMNCVATMQPDIVLMDIHLEGEIDGIETAGRIKKEFDIPVIIVSAHIDEATIYVPKQSIPMDFSENHLMMTT